MDSAETWPAQRICLLTGPPGLGKTTLAHIAARHCGYDVVEVNASDDRSAAVFGDYLESLAETRGMFGTVRQGESCRAKPKPACLIFDEADGAPQAAIDVLISYVTSDGGKVDKKKKGRRELRRPVICICNDQYATSLRNLRRHCFVVACLPPPPERLVLRVGEIARRERIEIESKAVSQIVERARGDIRVCVNILQTLKATSAVQRRQVATITSEQVAALPRAGFSKDVEQSMFECLEAIFQLPPATCKTSRFESVGRSVQMNTDHELLVQAIFENYAAARVRDDFLAKAAQMADWLAKSDALQGMAMSVTGSEIGFAMSYTTTPMIATACSLLFATPKPGFLAFPKSSIEMRQMRSQRMNLLTSFMAGLSPHERTYFSSQTCVIFDLLPSLIDIIQPTLRPVSTQLFSTTEKAEIARVVQVMASLGLTFVQRLTLSSGDRKQWQSGASQLGFYLEPPVDCLIVFERTKPGDQSQRFKVTADDKIQQQAHPNIWRLPQALRQYLASEITLFLARKAAIRATGPFIPQDESAGKSTKKAQPGMSTAALMEKDKAQAELMKQLEGDLGSTDEKVQTAISSFFKKTSTGKKSSSNALTAIRSPPGRSRDKVWFRFNEGYSNAVRRPARVKQFF